MLLPEKKRKYEKLTIGGVIVSGIVFFTHHFRGLVPFLNY